MAAMAFNADLARLALCVGFGALPTVACCEVVALLCTAFSMGRFPVDPASATDARRLDGSWAMIQRKRQTMVDSNKGTSTITPMFDLEASLEVTENTTDEETAITDYKQHTSQHETQTRSKGWRRLKNEIN
jgi:hypothetical protein